MTAYHTGVVWQERLPSTAKFVLLALADQAPDSGEVTIDMEMLRNRTGLGRDAIRFALRHLQDRAFLVRTRDSGADIEDRDQFRLNPSPFRRVISAPKNVPADLLGAINSDTE